LILLVWRKSTKKYRNNSFIFNILNIIYNIRANCLWICSLLWSVLSVFFIRFKSLLWFPNEPFFSPDKYPG